MGILDYVIFGLALGLAAAAILAPTRRRLRASAVLFLAAVATGYTILRPSPRAALAYHERMGGVWSQEWLAGITSYLAVTRYFSTVVLAAAILLAVIALRSSKQGAQGGDA